MGSHVLDSKAVRFSCGENWFEIEDGGTKVGQGLERSSQRQGSLQYLYIEVRRNIT